MSYYALAVVAFANFLDSRETAIIFWGLAVLVFVVVKDRSFVSSLLATARAVFASRLILLWVSTLGYCVGLVLVARTAGVWQATTIKQTVYWFFGTAVVLVGNATQQSIHDPGYFRKLVRTALALSVLVTFLANFYVFPLLVELVWIPLVALITWMQVVAARDPAFASVRKPINVMLSAFSLAVIAFVAVKVGTGPGNPATRRNAEDLLVPPAFSLAIIPLLCLVSWWSQRELELLRRRWSYAADS